MSDGTIKFLAVAAGVCVFALVGGIAWQAFGPTGQRVAYIVGGIAGIATIWLVREMLTPANHR